MSTESRSVWGTPRFRNIIAPFAVVVLIGVTPTGANVSDHPFTFMELYRALRLMGVPEGEAREAAHEAVEPNPPTGPEKGPAPRKPNQLDFYNEPSIQFVGDMLAVMSLVSDSVYQKVQRFRAFLRGSDKADPDEEHQWLEHRDEIGKRLNRPS